MISKDLKNEIILKTLDKEKKILISNVIDKVNLSIKTGRYISTDFLDLNDINNITPYLNKEKCKYYIYKPNEFMEKSICIFGLDKEELGNIELSDYMACIKIISNIKGKLIHKDYMGAIYSLGLKREKIGDIFVYNDVGYVFCIPSVKEYILFNLSSVGRQAVKLEEVNIHSKEILDISINVQTKNIIVPSIRLDSVISSVFNTSRGISKDKVLKEDVYVNCKEITNASYILSQGDIVSVKKFGKFKVGEILKETKNKNIVLKVFKYN